MSHLQKAFIAKAKSRMHKKPQPMTHGVMVREATRIYFKRPIPIRGLGLSMWWHQEAEYNKPEYLRFTLRK